MHVSFVIHQEETDGHKTDQIKLRRLVAYLEALVHDLGPLLGPLGQLGALHSKEVLLLLSRQRDVDPRQLEPLHAQLLTGDGAVCRQRRLVVVVLELHVQHGVHGGLVRLVRRRSLLPTARSLLDGPDRTANEKINDDEGAVVVLVVGKLRRKGKTVVGLVLPAEGGGSHPLQDQHNKMDAI
jgi:hypothetical protein